MTINDSAKLATLRDELKHALANSETESLILNVTKAIKKLDAIVKGID